MPEPVYETRTVAARFEMRDDDSGAPVLEGYAATFGTAYDLGPFQEQIHRNAFDRTLANNADVRLLIDHAGQPLARTKSGTLELSADERGLKARATLDPSDPDVQRLLPKMRRGDLDEMSFAFRLAGEGDSWDYGPDRTLRTIREASLAGGDVSVVTYPANPSTSVLLRSADLRSAKCAYAEHLLTEMRAGKAISAENMAKLKSVLDELATADDALDAAQASLSDVLSVANPDDADDSAPARSGRPLDLARRIHVALALHDYRIQPG